MDAVIWFIVYSLQPHIQMASALIAGFALLITFVSLVIRWFNQILE